MALNWRSMLAAAGVISALAWGLGQAGCGDDSGESSFVPPGDDGSTTPPGDEGMIINVGDGGINKPPTSIAIMPMDPVVNVAIANGVITTTPITFTAVDQNNNPVAASFLLDRGELGTLVSSTGLFTASGNVSGKANVTATFGGLTAKTTVSVAIQYTQNGKPPLPDGGAPDSGTLGGNNGVGGNDFGDPVDPTIVTLLNGPATKPSSPSELGFLYPYDQTVWPRGILAPLLQWQTTHAAATKYVRVHLSQSLFSFDGYYAAPSYVNHPVDEVAWKDALLGNTGDPLHVDLYISDGSTVWGPISEDWKVAAGILTGTVYYNSYNSHLATSGTGAVLAIKPGAYSPGVAIPGTETSCHVCHEVSSDGSTLITQDSSYSNGASYDLTKSGATIASYSGTASDGTSNNRKFLWSGMYPDGSFALSNSRHAREHATIDSNLFGRADGNAIQSTGFTGHVSAAVTPAFSPDGQHVTFNFWEGAGWTSPAITAGAGHSLVVMDFSCGASDGGKTCGAPPYTFSNPRELYRDSARYPGWAGFLPDESAIVFHNTVTAGACGDCELATWYNAQAELWVTDVGMKPTPMRMNAINGRDGAGNSYLPTSASHPDDTVLNYEPTINPVASGGYFWVVFTSRRMYGNVASGNAYDNGNGTYPIPKKLWVAAVDLSPTPGKDPSHPAFYLPGQEINAGNLRGFWVVDPCKNDGSSCTTGEECCGGFCESGTDGGGLMCTNTPPAGCSQIQEKCTTTADCCGASLGVTCINGFCSKPGPT